MAFNHKHLIDITEYSAEDIMTVLETATRFKEVNERRIKQVPCLLYTSHRIATCDECGGYLRTVYADDALAPFSFEVEDVIMARLDAIAAERG